MSWHIYVTTMLLLLLITICYYFYYNYSSYPSRFLHLHCCCIIPGAFNCSCSVDYLTPSPIPLIPDTLQSCQPTSSYLSSPHYTNSSVSWKAATPPQPCHASILQLFLKDLAETWSSLSASSLHLNHLLCFHRAQCLRHLDLRSPNNLSAKLGHF